MIVTSANSATHILIHSSEFANNGYGDGYSHNMYIGVVHSFTLRNSYSHDASVGHLIKSRALTNYILYNRLTGQTGSDSYELDIPQAGLSYVIGNVIQQGGNTQNPNMLAYGEEGVANPNSQLYVVNNTFVNDRGSGDAVMVGGSVTSNVVAQNNVSVGSPVFVSQSSAVLTTNCVTMSPNFVNAAAYDYHLAAGSPCINAGSNPGIGQGYGLNPLFQYVYNLSSTPRTVSGESIDAGAFEFGL